MLLQYQDVRFIKNLLDRYVLGQSEATRDIAMAVAQHFLACEYNESCKDDDKIQTDNVLIIGPSGVGKSCCIHTLKEMSKQYSFPMVFDSSSMYSPNPTWKGNLSIQQIVGQRLFMTAGDIFYENHPDNEDTEFATTIIKAMTERGIVVLDEADKIFKKTSDDCERSSSHDYQSSLLKLIEGTEIETDTFTHERKVPVANSATGRLEFETIVETIDSTTIDTTNILWILMGAFEGIENITKYRIQQENAKNNKQQQSHDYYQCCKAGFIQDAPAPAITKPVNKSTIVPAPNVDDLVTYGMKRELAGRLPIKVRFNPLNVNNLIKIMQDCPTSAYHEYQRRFKLMNHELTADTSALRYIAQKAVANKTGARSLRQIFNEILSPIMYQLSAESEPCVCRLAGKQLKNGKPPIIEKQKLQNTQSDEEFMRIINNSKIIKTESA